MRPGTWARGAFWSLAVLGIGGLLVRLDTDSRGVRSPTSPRSAPAPAPAVEELRAPALAVATPLAFAWPPTGRVRVHAEHEQGWTTKAEDFELEWRTQADGSVFVEAFAPFDAEPAPPGTPLPGTVRTGGTLCTPVQAVIASDGRFLRTPAFDDLRRAWERTGGHPAGMAVPEPLAARWNDWVERWLGVALRAGEQTSLSDGHDGELAWIRCTALDAEGTRLEYACTRQPRRFVAGQPDAVELVWPSDEREEVMLEYEHTAEVELATGLRPRSVATRERWTWRRSASEVVRTVERASRYAFDWTPPAPDLPAPTAQAPPPAASQLRVRTWLESGPPETCVDLLFVGEGYSAEDLGPEGRYWGDVERVARGLLAEAPLCWYRDWFNVRAAFLPVSEPAAGASALGIRLDAEGDFVLDERAPLLALARTVAEPDALVVLVNASVHSASSHALERPWVTPARLSVAIVSMGCDDPARTTAHELGHGLADLADEYVDESQPAWRLFAPNLTRIDGSGPWNHFRTLPDAAGARWFHEGANHAPRGYFRPWPRCRMDDDAEPFCPVCCEALARAIYRTCDLEWDDAAYHRAHPLARWPR